VSAFEKEYADFIGTRHCIGVGNGLDALRLIMKAWIDMGVMKEGDEVIVPANTYIATILAISDNRLKPVLVEPEIKTYNLDISHIERKITNRTRAVMVVHLYGQACWSEQLEELAGRYNLKIIEDNAQAAGAVVSMEQGARSMEHGAWSIRRGADKWGMEHGASAGGRTSGARSIRRGADKWGMEHGASAGGRTSGARSKGHGAGEHLPA